MNYRTLQWRWFSLSIGLVFCISYATFTQAAVVDCAKVMGNKKQETFKADAKDVQQCILRGYDAPTNWKRDKGKSAGIRVGGSGGFSYGTVQAPESPQQYMKRGIKASVDKDVIFTSCSFPPRIKVNTGGVSIPKGSCLDFINGLLKDKDEDTNDKGTPDGVSPNDSCPIETDSTGVYGDKLPITGGGSKPLACGGMLPMTATDLVLNHNPTNFISTENGAYYLWYYKKSGGSFSGPAAPLKLPTYLCKPDTSGDAGAGMVKSVDLTPPVAQIITYDPSVGEINIRLQSRQSMTAGFVPPYDPDQPEKFLVIPVDGSGTPDVPPDCALEDTYFKEPTSREDIYIESATNGGCTGFSALPAYSGGLPKPVACPGPDVAIPGSKLTMPCADYNGLLKTCGATGTVSTVPASCDTVSISPTGTVGTTVCDGKTQTAVLNRPNLYYAPGTTAKLYPVTGRTALMAETLDGSEYYTQESTIFKLQKTAPALKLNEGGYVTLKDGSIFIMRPPAIISPKSNQIQFIGGAEHVTSGGTLKQTYPEKSTYSSNLIAWPMEVKVVRSVTFPAGFMLPTMPKVSDPASPYIRLPAAAPPQ